MAISRLYDFTPSTLAQSGQVDDELNQVVSEVNLMLKKSGAEAMTGDLTITKANPAVVLQGTEASGKNWRLREDAGVLYLQVDSGGYQTFLLFDLTNTFMKSAHAILPSTDAAKSLGSSSFNWDAIYLDKGVTDGGTVFFNAGGSFLRGDAGGTILDVGGDITNFRPDGDGDATLGDGSHRWARIFLSELGDSNTPAQYAVYGDLVPKAWAETSGTGTIDASCNLTLASGGTGTYIFSFRRNMTNANYAVLATASNTSGGTNAVICQVLGAKAASGFTIEALDASGDTLYNGGTIHVVALGRS